MRWPCWGFDERISMHFGPEKVYSAGESITRKNVDLGQRKRGMDRLRPTETRTLPGRRYIQDAGRSETPVKVEERWAELQEYPVRNHSETKVFSLKLLSCNVWRTWRYLHVGQRKGRNCVEVPNEFSVVSNVYAGAPQAHKRCVDS